LQSHVEPSRAGDRQNAPVDRRFRLQIEGRPAFSCP
jgi:hypothetical protein